MIKLIFITDHEVQFSLYSSDGHPSNGSAGVVVATMDNQVADLIILLISKVFHISSNEGRQASLVVIVCPENIFQKLKYYVYKSYIIYIWV